MKLFLIFGVIFLSSLYSRIGWTCGTSISGKKVSYQKLRHFYDHKTRKISSTELVKFADANPHPSWEAKLGNLLLAQARTNSEKVVLSLPVKLPKGTHSPFGDGQLNAKMDFGSFSQKDFPVVGYETTKLQQKSRRYEFNQSLLVAKFTESKLNDGWFEVKTEDKEGHSKGTYYFNFDTSSLQISELIQSIPAALRTYPNNRVAPNVAGISKANPIRDLNETDLGPGFNTHNPWLKDNVHGRFPDNDASGIVTALGGVQTWGTATEVAERPASGPWKYLYTCFDPRIISNETTSGVPSGAGWHYVGDPAETVLNNLNTESLPFAIARAHHKADAADGYTESITAFWLQPDEAQVTRQGEFHWYVIPYENPVCTEIWVQPCVPNLTNNWGFKNDCDFH